MQSDKASVLDEAIEYMKSLQLQLQVLVSSITKALIPDLVIELGD